MDERLFSRRITIVTITALLIFSGFMLGISLPAKRARADAPIFATINYNNPPTGGDSFWVSANISEVPGAHQVFFNCTIVSLSSESHARNLAVTNHTGTSWLIEMFVPIPNDGTTIDFNFTAHNTTDGGMARSNNGTISITDTLKPTAIAKCNTTAQPTLKDAITVVEGTTVNFDGSGTTDNLLTDSWANSKWKWEILPALTKQGETQTHTFADEGVYIVTLNVSDAADNWDTDTVTVTVEPADMPPVLAPQAVTYIAGLKDLVEDSDYTNITLLDNGTGTDYLFNYTGPGVITFKVNASGTMQDTYESDNLTGEIADVNGTKIFTIKPKENVYFKTDVVENVTINATTAVGSIEYMIQFKITSVNDAAVFVQPSGDTASVNEGAERTITVVAKDSADPEDTLTLTTNITTVIPALTATVVDTIRDNATNTHTFKLNLTPTNDMVGDYNVSLMITDDDAGSSTKAPLVVQKNITLSIKNTNDAPSFGGFKIGDKEGKEGDDGAILFDIDEDEEVVINITIEDPDLLHDDVVFTVDIEEKKNYSKESTKDNVKIELVGNKYANLTFLPLENHNGPAMVRISLSDGTDVVYQYINFTVKPMNDDPNFATMKIEPGYRLIDEATYTYNLWINDTAKKTMLKPGDKTDIDGDNITFHWFFRADPTGKLIFNESWNSTITGMNITHQFPFNGSHSVWLKATDGKGGSAVKKFITEMEIEEYIPPSKNGDDGLGIWLFVIIGAVVLVVIVVIVVIILMKKKGGDKEEEDEFGDMTPPDQQMGMPGGPGVDQFGQPIQPGMPGQQQPAVDQFGQPIQQGMPAARQRS